MRTSNLQTHIHGLTLYFIFGAILVLLDLKKTVITLNINKVCRLLGAKTRKKKQQCTILVESDVGGVVAS